MNGLWQIPQSMDWFRFWLVLTCWAVAWVQEAQADFFMHTWEEHWQKPSWLLMKTSQSYYTSRWVHPTSKISKMDWTISDYHRFQSDVSLSYGMTLDWTVFGRLTTGWMKQQRLGKTEYDWGFMDQTLGLNYRWKSIASIVDWQTQVDFPVYRIPQDSHQMALLGDGSWDWSTGFFLHHSLARWLKHQLWGHLGLAYTYRTLGFASHLLTTVSLDYQPNEHSGWFLGLSGLGRWPVESIQSSPQMSMSWVGWPAPSWIQYQGHLGYQVSEKLKIQCLIRSYAWEKESPSGHFGQLEFWFSWDTRARAKNPLLQTPQTYNASNQSFVNYSLDAQVIQQHDRLNLVKINKGYQDGVEIGQVFDLFSLTTEGEIKEAVARARVTHHRLREAVLEVIEFYQDLWIEVGFIAKRLIE